MKETVLMLSVVMPLHGSLRTGWYATWDQGSAVGYAELTRNIVYVYRCKS